MASRVESKSKAEFNNIKEIDMKTLAIMLTLALILTVWITKIIF